MRLSPAQREYLMDATYLASELRETLATGLHPSNPPRFEVDTEIAQRFASAFTERLAHVGFDRDYELTEEGAALEDLIDLFSGREP